MALADDDKIVTITVTGADVTFDVLVEDEDE